MSSLSLLKHLIKEKPDEFQISQLKTLQRRVSSWRLEQLKIHQEAQSQKSPIQEQSAAYSDESEHPFWANVYHVMGHDY